MNTEIIPLIDQIEVERQVVVNALLVTDGILDIVGQIEEQARDKAKDVDSSTDKGRKELASIAYAVSKA